MLNYDNFILEQTIYKLILESKVQFSDNFIGVLKTMDSPVAKAVLSLHNQDKEVAQNYIDADLKTQDMITFIQDRRAKQLTQDREDFYIMTNAGKHLKVKDFKTEQGRQENMEIFKLLGLDIADSKRATDDTQVPQIRLLNL